LRSSDCHHRSAVHSFCINLPTFAYTPQPRIWSTAVREAQLCWSWSRRPVQVFCPFWWRWSAHQIAFCISHISMHRKAELVCSSLTSLRCQQTNPTLRNWRRSLRLQWFTADTEVSSAFASLRGTVDQRCTVNCHQQRKAVKGVCKGTS
jgi:hypothetical protein